MSQKETHPGTVDTGVSKPKSGKGSNVIVLPASPALGPRHRCKLALQWSRSILLCVMAAHTCRFRGGNKTLLLVACSQPLMVHCPAHLALCVQEVADLCNQIGAVEFSTATNLNREEMMVRYVAMRVLWSLKLALHCVNLVSPPLPFL